MSVYFEVMGAPQGKGRPRFTRHGKPFTPAKTAAYERQIRAAYEHATDVSFGDDPIIVMINAFYEVPKSTSKKRRQEIFDNGERPTKKPDGDNIAKVICDALNGIAYKDDAQIVELRVCKEYTQACARVTVWIERA